MNTLKNIRYLSLCYLVLSLLWSYSAMSQTEVELKSVVVQQGESLFRIAMENRPDQTVSLQQTMVAIQRLNPNAFVDGNINRVKAGERILMPSIRQIREVDLGDAILSISDQNQEFRDNNSSDITINGEQEEGQLSILRADSEPLDISSGLLPLEQENAELDQRLIELENILAIQLEERDRSRLRREELTSRLSQLNTQIDDAKELIRLQDLQLEQIRAQLAEASLQAAEIETPPFMESIDVTDDSTERESGWGKVLNSVSGFFQSNSPLVTIAAPLALFLLGWLLWWDRVNYAESRPGGVVEISENSLQKDTRPNKDLDKTFRGTETDLGAPNDLIQEKAVEEVLEISETEPESVSDPPVSEGIEFIGGSSDDESFADLEFLSEEEREELDVPQPVEEIFYLGDEESATKLELAYAYVKMNDHDGAREILSEVIEEGNPEQKKEAEKLLALMDS